MDKRFICKTCGVKWFVPATVPVEDDPGTCGACDGRLEPLAPAQSG